MNTPLSRRAFLRAAAGAGAACALPGPLYAGQRDKPARPTPAFTPSEQRKLIVVIFGGGTRSSESIDDPGRRYIPHLACDMVPRATLFTNMRVEHRVVHPNCAASILTGHWEWDDNDWTRPVAHPTIFELHRRARQAPDIDAWAFVYASILAQAGHSRDPDHGARYAANVVEPPTIPRATAEQMARDLQSAAATGSPDNELAATRRCARLARDTSRIARGGLRSPAAHAFLDREYETWKTQGGTTSHDAFLTDRAIACMRSFAPSVITVAFGEIDCAHYGSWSRYVEAIRRTDELTWRLWRATEELPAYQGRTLMLVLPDHGRELDSTGKWGFVHHSNFYTNEGADEGCRRVWMLALGPGVGAGQVVEKPVPTTAAAATGLEYLGLTASRGAADGALRYG